MNFFIKTFVILIIVSVSKSCVTNNRNNIQKINIKKLSSGVVVICAKDKCPFELNSEAHYGSLIHPQAVLTSNEYQLIAKNKNYCFAGCPTITVHLKECQIRTVSNTYLKGVNVVLILEKPFAINENTNVIKLIKSKDLILDSNCYFYAATLDFSNIPTTGATFEKYKYTFVAASYRTKITNGIIGSYRNHNGNFTQVVDSSVSVNHTEMIFKDYCSSPIVCQLRDDPSSYGQIGFFSFNQTVENKSNLKVDGVSDYNNFNRTQVSYINLGRGYVLKLQDSYQDITDVRDDIYYTLINHFNLTSIVESLYDNRFYAFKNI